MAPDSDEDEIWNYQVKATPGNKGPKTKIFEEDGSRESVTQDTTVQNIIIIDSEDDDTFFEKINKRGQQQTEHWKFLTDKGPEQKKNIKNLTSKAGRGRKRPSLICGKNQKKKLPKKSSKFPDRVDNSAKKCDELSSETSSSQNSLKDYYSPSKQGNCKRKMPDLDILCCNEDDICDQAGKHYSQAKKTLLNSGNECQESSTINSKESVDYKCLSRNSSCVKDIPGTDELENYKCEIMDNVNGDVDSPPVVNVLVLREDFCHSDQSEIEPLNEKDREELPGGFSMDGEDDLFEEACEGEDSKSNADDIPGQKSSSCLESHMSRTPSSDLQIGAETEDLLSLPKTVHSRSSDCTNTAKVDSDVLHEPKASSLLKAQTQTSLYSFFKARPTPSIGKPFSAASSAIDPIKAVYGQVASRPSLRSYSSTPVSSSYQNKHPFVKVKSATDILQTVPQPQAEGSGKGYNRNNRQCPFYKKIPGTSITVDAFRYRVIPGCQAYFLTHFHYDHYGGLTKKFSQPIFCSQVTGNLVESRLGVNNKWINRLPMWKPCQVADATLTLMEANHCPGAVIVLFETKDGRKILHTGDFRACPEMESYPMIMNIAVDELYLDTTYCNPSYNFPSQKEVIDFVVSVVEKHVAAHPKTLIVCGAYTIGKEKIFSAIAKALDSKICVMNDKKKVLDCLQDKELKSRLTMNWSEGQVHVLPMRRLNQQSLHEHHERHTRFTSILAFEPTGWTHSSKSIGLGNLRPKWSSHAVTLYGVPYSEHSSFTELKRFVQFLGPRKILPTVNNGNPESRKKMEDIFRVWEKEKRDSVTGVSPLKASSLIQPVMDLWMAS